MEDLLREAIAGYEAEMTEFTKSLIAIPTENPPGTAYRACVDLIAGKLAEIGLEPTLVEVPADRPGQTFEGLRQQGVELEVEILQEAPSAGVDDRDPVAVALARSIETVTGERAVFEMCPGLLETRWYARRGVPAFAYGPGLLTVSHGPHEFVPLKNIRSCALIYALTAVRLLGGLSHPQPNHSDGRRSVL